MLFETFRAKAEAVGAEVHRVPHSAAPTLVADILRREGVEDAAGARAVWCDGPILGELGAHHVASSVPGVSREVTRGRAAESRVGVTEVDWAVADTGTLVHDASDPRLRLASALTETHVAVVRADRLLPDLATLLGRIDPARVRYLACITGPSRTADIERVLTIGVHGPKKLVVVAVDCAEERS